MQPFLQVQGRLEDLHPVLTISFSGQIPVFTGNEISFRNFGKFRRISVNFGRNLLNFEFENEIFRKIPKFRIPVTSGNEKFPEISLKLLTLARREADENLRQCGPTRPNVRERTKNPYKMTYIQPSWTDLMTSKIFQSVNMHIL